MALATGIPGLLLHLGGGGFFFAGLMTGQAHAFVFGMLLMLVSSLMQAIGLGYYARSRGRSWAWAVLGLLSLPGLAVGIWWLGRPSTERGA
jgi:hypothetical protein